MNDFAHQKYLVKNLINWNTNDNKRQMPWKGEKDPYKIWLSEIILQQTRVEQGLDYYNRFVKAFPTVIHLAGAAETKVFKLWEGLGYYTRCKNLIATAKYITNNLSGIFPDKYEDILALKGIGPYTAAAIGSFAFNLPHAVVDGNVFRVLSRYFGIAIPTDSTDGKKIFSSLANDLLDKKQPGTYNQAIMDFGALICKPKLPLCSTCVLKDRCKAFLQASVQQLPVKEKSITKKTRWFYYLVIDCNEEVYVRKRGKGDIWENLYEFILIETSEAVQLENFQPLKKILGKNKFEVEHISAFYKQLLTHQTIQGQFIRVKIKLPLTLKGYSLVKKRALEKLPFPKFISNYLKDKNVSLNLF
ncbi:MAG: A/G-specific adenine glycosylase [Ferruginibacter sp.]|nr:A/G-specific adenine glycosylase [Ferruginibacter sp.]